jgi:hypothetical protein
VPATSRSAFRRPQELDRRGTGEGDRVAAQLVDDRRALATKPPYVGRRVLPERGVVAGPVMEVGRLRSRVSKHSSEGCDRRALSRQAERKRESMTINAPPCVGERRPG